MLIKEKINYRDVFCKSHLSKVQKPQFNYGHHELCTSNVLIPSIRLSIHRSNLCSVRYRCEHNGSIPRNG